ncbi:MAG: OmpH family outer membrane protein [Gammaproteobacteria bacterium]|nr:OmpH family outer membrane protein [Gammaproteobacteria bacterium]
MIRSLLLALCLLPSVLHAELSVAFVDINKLLDLSKPAVEASRQLESAFSGREAELAAMQAKLAQLERDIAAADNEDVKQLATHESAALSREFKRAEQSFKRDLAVQKNAEYRRVRQLIEGVIREYAEKNRIGIVLSEGVIFADDNHDVTDEILLIVGAADDGS